MKNKSLNIFIFSLLILMAFNLISATSYSFKYKLAPENSELNWYFVNRGNDQIPECPKESAEFLDTYDAYYVGDTENKIIYLIVVGIIGISLFITGIVRDGNTIVGFGAALTAVSILKVIQYAIILSNPEKRKKLEINQNEERYVMIAHKSGYLTLMLTLIAEAAAAITLMIIGNSLYEFVCTIMAAQSIIYLITYYILSRKY